MNFNVTLPSGRRLPVVLSIPHCGTEFPDDLKSEFDPLLINRPDDTDWYVDRLYAFAAAMGATIISGVWSRWVIDLNRDPEGRALYSDGRIITDLCPLTTFLGEQLYRDGRKALPKAEVERRRRRYFFPYHEKLQELLRDIKAEFGRVLLWDCHSIRQVVPTIQQAPFPDLILGSADSRSAHPRLIEDALRTLGRGTFSLQHNNPFKGGYITRHYGHPERHEHTLQLEMSKINYMDITETRYDPEKAQKIEELLSDTLVSVSRALISIKD